MRELARGQGHREQPALSKGHAASIDIATLLLRLDAFRHGHDVELPGEVGQRIEDGRVALLKPNGLNERAVDLEELELEPLQVAQAGYPAPKSSRARRMPLPRRRDTASLAAFTFWPRNTFSLTSNTNWAATSGGTLLKPRRTCPMLGGDGLDRWDSGAWPKR